MKFTLILLVTFGFLFTGCTSYSNSYYSPYDRNNVNNIHNRFDQYERNAHMASIYNTMNYNTNQGMGF